MIIELIATLLVLGLDAPLDVDAGPGQSGRESKSRVERERCAQAPLWCDPKMVALKIADAQGEIEVRAENGAAISWRRPGWAASISLKALRVDGGKVRLQVFLPAKTGGPRLSAEAVLAKGESLELSAASWAPPNLFGPGQAKARIICDE